MTDRRESEPFTSNLIQYSVKLVLSLLFGGEWVASLEIVSHPEFLGLPVMPSTTWYTRDIRKNVSVWKHQIYSTDVRVLI